MSGRRLLLEGVRGLFADERFLVGEGCSVTVGRSRSCEVSVTRTRAYRNIGRQALERNRAFRKMSRRHFEVRFEGPDRVVIRDLSTNGVFVDERHIREAVFTWDELRVHGVVILFGAGEGVRLRAVSEETATGVLPPSPAIDESWEPGAPSQDTFPDEES